MNDSEHIAQLKEMLASHLIKKRKVGIKMAATLLTEETQIQLVRSLLLDIAQNDSMLTIREAAQSALDADENRRTPLKPDYIFGAKCPECDKVTYLDKREVCQKQGDVVRHDDHRNSQETDTILVTCNHCHKDFKTLVPCKGYK